MGRTEIAARIERRSRAAPVIAALLAGCSAPSPPPPPANLTAPSAPRSEVVVAPSPPRSSASTPPGSAPLACPSDMVLVPAGSLRRAVRPHPRQTEALSAGPLCLDRAEVTVRDYLACARDPARACSPLGATETDAEGKPEAGPAGRARFCNGGSSRLDHPASCVDWEQAVRYCRGLGRRLPTADEWELAARGPDGRVHPWGDGAPSELHANLCGAECAAPRRTGEALRWRPAFAGSDGFPATAPVGSFPLDQSPAGARDLAGNVAEWTATDACAVEDRLCPSTTRVIRGGSWYDGEAAPGAYLSLRFEAPRRRLAIVGFRCAWSG